MKPDLTPRELDVLWRLPLHMSSREIATEEFISANTVRTHVKNIYRKLGVTSRAAAVLKAKQLGLIPGGDRMVGNVSPRGGRNNDTDRYVNDAQSNRPAGAT